MMQMIPNAEMMIGMLPEPTGTLEKMSKLRQPVLLIHGTNDEIVPVSQAVKAHDTCPAEFKMLQQVSGASHNDVHLHARDQYWTWFGQLLDAAAGERCGPQAATNLTPEEVEGLSVSELKKAMTARGIDFSHCVEKGEMQALL